MPNIKSIRLKLKEKYNVQDLDKKYQISRSEVNFKVKGQGHWDMKFASLHLPLLFNIYAKYPVNQVETEGEVRRTRFCRQTYRPTDRPTDRPTS